MKCVFLLLSRVIQSIFNRHKENICSDLTKNKNYMSHVMRKPALHGTTYGPIFLLFQNFLQTGGFLSQEQTRCISSCQQV